MFKALTGN
jgi:actin-related protein